MLRNEMIGSLYDVSIIEDKGLLNVNFSFSRSQTLKYTKIVLVINFITMHTTNGLRPGLRFNFHLQK